MAKRRSEAAMILKFFETAPVDTANVVFDLVREKLKARRGPVAVATTKKKKQQPVEEQSAPAASA